MSVYDKPAEVVWTVHLFEGTEEELHLRAVGGSFFAAFPRTPKGARDAFDTAIENGATHVRFPFDLKVIDA